MKKIFRNKIVLLTYVFMLLFAMTLLLTSKPTSVSAASEATGKGIINVYLIGGQSNAVGYGMDDAADKVSSLDSRYTDGFSNVLYYGVHERNNNSPVYTEFVPVKLGIGETKIRSGAEIGIANVLGDTDTMNAVIKCARGASWLYPDTNANVSIQYGTWTPPSYIARHNVSTVNNSVGNMYVSFINTVIRGLEMLEEQGYTPVIKGMWWMQGEAESNNNKYASKYVELLTDLINDVRSDLSEITGIDLSNMPFVAGHIYRNPDYTPNSDIETINNAQKTVAQTLNNVSVVDIKNCSALRQHDAWHFDAMTQKWFGEQFMSELSKMSTDIHEVVSISEDVEVRLDEHKGLKFKANIINYDKNHNYKYGMMIVPTDYLANVNGDYINYFKTNNKNVVDLQCNVLNSNGKYYIQGSLVNIKYKNLSRYFTALAYIMDENGNVVYSSSHVNASLANLASREISNYSSTDSKYTELLNFINGSINYANGVSEINKYDPATYSINVLNEVALNKGFTHQLEVTKTPELDLVVSYSSSNEKVCNVDSNGLITAVGAGSAKVYVQYVNAKKEVNVTVDDSYALDGDVDDGIYRDSIAYHNDNSATYSNHVEQEMKVVIGTKGLHIMHNITDSMVKADTRLEAFLSIGEVSDSTTWQFRFYPASTAYTVRIYRYAGAATSWPWVETVEVEILYTSKVTDYGYTVEAFIPYTSIGLTKAPKSVNYLSFLGFYNGSSVIVMDGHNGCNQSTYVNTTANYHEFDKTGYVYDSINVDNIKLNPNNLVNGNYEHEFTVSTIDSLNVLEGIKFIGTGAEYITELGEGKYKLSIPSSKISTFDTTQTITVKDPRNLGATFTVGTQSNVEVTGVEIVGKQSNLVKGTTLQLSAQVLPSNAQNKNVTWSSSDANVVTVNASGLVTAVGYGKATITLRSHNGYTDTFTIYVTEVFVDGVSNDEKYANLAKFSNEINSNNYNTEVKQDVRIYIGETGLYIVHDVKDKYVSGDNTRLEAFLYIGGISDTTTWQFRLYPSSKTYTVRSYNYKSSNPSWPWNENKNFETVFASTISNSGYTVELYIPYASLGLSAKPTEVYYNACLGFNYYKSGASSYSNTVMNGYVGYTQYTEPTTKEFYHKFNSKGYLLA